LIKKVFNGAQGKRICGFRNLQGGNLKSIYDPFGKISENRWGLNAEVFLFYED
jgi:hypothetical protein